MDNTTDLIEQTIQANIVLHSKMADEYSTCEPHFRPENIYKVEEKIKNLAELTNAKKLLDLGCGTGFVINIAKKYVEEIDGVDVTQAMMDKVDLSGSATIRLHNHDTGTFPVEKNTYDLVTGYSFLHHLYDIKPTLQTAFNALKGGGALFIDLDPNYYFWESINNLSREGNYDSIVKREIEMVTYKDEDIEKNFGVSKEIFNQAEFGKNIKGGFKEEDLKALLSSIGFTKIDIFYYWYLGQASMLNDSTNGTKEERIRNADQMDKILQQSLPLSRNLYKYLGFVAFK